MPRIPLLIVSIFFMSGGVSHFLFIDFFVRAMPDYIPLHKELVIISGIFEILGAVGILVPKTRLFSAVGLILLCIAVFPANMNMAINSHLYGDVSPIMIYLRLPFQLVIIWFIWWSVAAERAEKGWLSAESPLMQNLTVNSLEQACVDFARNFSDVLSWQWDDRYNVVMADYKISEEKNILSGLEYYFGYFWDLSTLPTAPVEIQQIATRFDGLKPGQMLLATNPEKKVFIYCVLWPWECGTHVSLRLAVFTRDDAGQNSELQEQLKSWFNLNDRQVDRGWVKVNQA